MSLLLRRYHTTTDPDLRDVALASTDQDTVDHQEFVEDEMDDLDTDQAAATAAAAAATAADPRSTLAATAAAAAVTARAAQEALEVEQREFDEDVPKRNASRATWETYALAHGYDAEDLEHEAVEPDPAVPFTRDEIAALILGAPIS